MPNTYVHADPTVIADMMKDTSGWFENLKQWVDLICPHCRRTTFAPLGTHCQFCDQDMMSVASFEQQEKTMPDEEKRQDPVIAIAGNVGKDPKTNFTPSGRHVCNFTLAVPGGYGDDAPTYWYDVAVWVEPLIESVMREVHKGSRVAVEGFFSQQEKEGRTYNKLSAVRVGLVDWLKRVETTSAAEPPKTAAPAAAGPMGVPASQNATNEAEW